MYFKRLDEIGDKKYCNIKVVPFSIERDGIEFGLIPRDPEEKGQRWWLRLSRATTWRSLHLGTAVTTHSVLTTTWFLRKVLRHMTNLDKEDVAS